MFRKTLYLQLPSSEPPDNSLLRALLLLSDLMPLNACVPESATWITYFRFLSIAASSPTAIIGAVCLKSAIGLRISVFCLGTVIRSNRFRYLCIYFLKTLLRIRSVSQFIAPLGRRGISAPVLQGKKSWLVITISIFDLLFLSPSGWCFNRQATFAPRLQSPALLG